MSKIVDVIQCFYQVKVAVRVFSKKIINICFKTFLECFFSDLSNELKIN